MPGQYKIPQKLDIEEKIIGPFTLKQFLYLVFAALIVYVLYKMFFAVSPGTFFLSALPVAILALAMVFIKVNERSFEEFFLYFLAFVINPRSIKWEKAPRVRSFEVMAKKSAEEENYQKRIDKLAKKGVVRSQLSELAKVLDTQGWSTDVNQSMMEGRVVSSYSEKSVLKQTLGEDEKLDDLFGDLEGALDSLKEKYQEEEIEEDFSKI